MQTSSNIEDQTFAATAPREPRDILLAVTAKLADELYPDQGIGASVNLDSDLGSDLGFDSLTRMELVHRIEEEFNTALSDEALGRADSLRDLLTELLRRLSRDSAEADIRPALPVSAEFRQSAPPDIAYTQQTPDDADTLTDVLSWHARVHADKAHLHLISGNDVTKTVTYGALYEQAARVAEGLLAKGLEPGARVLLMLPTGLDYFFGFFGTLLAGGLPVPIYPPGRPQQLEEHLQRHAKIAVNAGPVIMLTVPEALHFSKLMAAQVRGLRLITTVEDIVSESLPRVLPTISPHDAAFLQYTSGSTSDPKGVILSHANLLANIRAMGRALDAGPDDVFVSWLPLYHDMGLIGAWLGSLTYGMPLVIMSPLTFLSRPSRWLNAIHTYKGTISGAPNFAYDLCTTRIGHEDLADLDLSSWRVAFNGAEAVSPETLQHFAEHFAPFGFRDDTLMPVYGLAENSVGLAFPPLKRQPKIDLISRKALQDQGRAVPTFETDRSGAIAVPACGMPLPGHQIRIVDATGRELGDRHQGRIQFKGPSSTSGYFRNREATQNLFDDQWLNSGDLGYLSEGEIYITGRQKDLIIRAGRNIYPAELETAIGALDGIQLGNVAVFASSHPQTGTERLVVMAESRRWKEEDQTRLKRSIAAISIDLTGAAPDEILLVPPRSVPKTSSGKIRRNAARQLYETGNAGASGMSLYWQTWKLGTLTAFQLSLLCCQRASAWLYAGYAWLILVLMAVPVWTGVVLIHSRAVRWSFLKTSLTLMRMLTGISLTVDGTEKIVGNGPVIFSANHSSYLDGAVLISALPSPFGFVVKGELKIHFIPRLFLRRLGCHFVERFDVEKSLTDTEYLSEALTTGQSLGYFPEGTFSRMPGLLPFHMGAFTIAVMTGTPIQPIAIRGARATLREGTAFPRRGRIQVKIMDPIHPRQKSESQWQAALALRDEVRRGLLAHIGEPDLAHERVFQELSIKQKNDHG